MREHKNIQVLQAYCACIYTSHTNLNDAYLLFYKTKTKQEHQHTVITVLLSSCRIYTITIFAETMSKCYVIWEVTWHNVHCYKQSVLQGHTAVNTSLSVCAVPLSAICLFKKKLFMKLCMLGVNRPTWFPNIIHLLFVITILSIPFY